MPAVEDLLCLRGSFCCSAHIFAGTIATNEFHSGVLYQPLRKGFSRALGEQGDRAM